jgi:phosphinothricin acetyltransferase
MLVYDDGSVRGYASSSPLKDRPAYATSVELSVYLAPDARGRGLGRALLDALLARLEREPLHRAYACIALPNPASERLFLTAGFARVGHFREVGHKLGRYWDVVWLERPLRGLLTEDPA